MRAVAIREDIKDLVLDAADQLLERYGFRKMTMDDLAHEVGVAKGTVYQHFASKEDVALARIDRVVADLLRQMSDIASQPVDPSRRLKAMLERRVMFRIERVRGSTESIEDQLTAIRPALRQRQRHYFEQEAAVIARVLSEGRRTGTFKVKDVEDTAHALIIATNGLIPSNLGSSLSAEPEVVKRHVRRITELLAAGLGR